MVFDFFLFVRRIGCSKAAMVNEKQCQQGGTRHFVALPLVSDEATRAGLAGTVTRREATGSLSLFLVTCTEFTYVFRRLTFALKKSCS